MTVVACQEQLMIGLGRRWRSCELDGTAVEEEVLDGCGAVLLVWLQKPADPRFALLAIVP